MAQFFWLGTGLGFLAGALHAAHIIGTQSSLPGSDARTLAVYRAIWALVLWTVFGSYLLALWCAGLIMSTLSGRRAAGKPTA